MPILHSGCTRRALLATTLATPALAAGSSRFFTTSDGVRLHYVTAGAGMTLVLVPGWTMPAWIFDPQIESLYARWHIVVLDPRGQGRSDIPRHGYEPARRGRDVAELLAHLDRPRVVLGGWSLGVLDALSCVNATGDARLAGLLLIDNSVGEGAAPLPRSGNFFRNLRQNRDATVRGFCASMFRTPRDAAYLERLARDAQRMPVENSIRLLSYARPREFWRDTLYATRRPVLYAVTPRFRGQADLVAQRHAAAEADIYEGAGHALFVDEAARFNDSVDHFLRRRARWA